MFWPVPLPAFNFALQTWKGDKRQRPRRPHRPHRRWTWRLRKEQTKCWSPKLDILKWVQMSGWPSKSSGGNECERRRRRLSSSEKVALFSALQLLRVNNENGCAQCMLWQLNMATADASSCNNFAPIWLVLRCGTFFGCGILRRLR